MTETVCIYHGDCTDGFGAAWAVWTKNPNWEFHPGIYQLVPPDVTGKNVVMVDFSYKREVILKMAETANDIFVLDHHKSAYLDLKDINKEQPKVTVYFDMDRSGAGIAWDWYHHTPRPKLIDYIEDRDLWRFKLEGTREIIAALDSYERDFTVWDGLMQIDIDSLFSEGEHIVRAFMRNLTDILPTVTRTMRIGNHYVPVANLPYIYASEAGHILCEGQPFSATYFESAEGRQFSLRSANDGVDVSEIAILYGGGGHKHAAGFFVPRNDAKFWMMETDTHIKFLGMEEMTDGELRQLLEIKHGDEEDSPTEKQDQ